MDPYETLLRILDAVKCEEADDLRDAADDLATWIEGGGYLPSLRVDRGGEHATVEIGKKP